MTGNFHNSFIPSFTETLHNIVVRHRNVVETMAFGIMEWSEKMSRESVVGLLRAAIFYLSRFLCRQREGFLRNGQRKHPVLSRPLLHKSNRDSPSYKPTRYYCEILFRCSGSFKTSTKYSVFKVYN